MAKNLWVFFVVLCVAYAVENQKEVFTPEIECTRAGGVCMHRTECPGEKVSEEGQCPIQSNLGAVCCHGLPISETNCEKLGGHCTKVCNIPLVQQANSCGADEVCCPLV